MKNRKLWAGLLAGLMAVGMSFGIFAGSLPTQVSAEKSSAQIQQEINEMKEQLKNNRSEVAKLEAQVNANMDKMEDIVANKNTIDQQIFLYHEQVENLNKQITAYSSLIADKQAELDEATARWQALSDKYKERIRAMEEDGKLSYWSVLFKANSFSDFLDRLSMIDEIAAADQRRLEELNNAAKEVESAKTGLEAEKLALESGKKELEDASKKLEESRAEADKLLKQLIATGEEYQRLLDEAEKKESETASQVDKLEYAYDAAKEREYQQWLASQPPVQSGSAANTVNGLTWLLPVNYTRFSSPFGYRIHPVYGDWRFHYGVDLSAPSGTPIYASRGGKVTYATYDSSSGYYVSINHLDGFTTKYLHMTHYIVSPGQYVAAGQVIGYVGSTGTSTGPHLHFSVYYNGSAVNPANYINIS
ncbi:MAG: hypothetical protein E7421_04325 [Ruminococcaceae bacterium]|nr:hypothetical protein [Oscillospiraceae bacterium]